MKRLSDVTLSLVTSEFGDAVDAISYVTRIETRMTDIEVTVDAGLVASDATFTDAAALRVNPKDGTIDASSAVSFADLSDVSLIVRSAPGYGQNVPDLKGKDLACRSEAMSDLALYMAIFCAAPMSLMTAQRLRLIWCQS